MSELQENYSTTNYAREGVKIGLINGAVAMLLVYGSYALGFDTFYRIYFINRFLPYMLILIIIHGLNLRKKEGGYLTFKDALKFAFTSYIIAELIVGIGSYILFNVVDPNLTRMIAEENVRRYPEQLQILKLSKEEYIRQNSVTGARTVILGTGQALLIDFILSILSSLIIRKEKPIF